MCKRFLSLWFSQLKTDWFARRRPGLKDIAFVLTVSDHGRLVVSAANNLAKQHGILEGMNVADARVLFPALTVLDDEAGLEQKLLTGLAGWCIRFTPSVATDAPQGLMLDVTGCAHLWGGEAAYVKDIQHRLASLGYCTKAGIADTIGAAWAVARFSSKTIVPAGMQQQALMALPAAALRLQPDTIQRLQKLGLQQVAAFMTMPRPALRRRFGSLILQRLQQAMGQEEENIQPLHPAAQYQERLPCIDAILYAAGIEIAIQRLLDAMCARLLKEQKGLRAAILKCYRIDGKIEIVRIGTNRPTCNAAHLFKLFQLKIDAVEPAMGIELFTLDAEKVEDLNSEQEQLWQQRGGIDAVALCELLDRIAGKLGGQIICRYLPDEHYWPERSYKKAGEQMLHAPVWPQGQPRPLHLLQKPEPIEVTAPIPDYPPMLFRYKNQLHKIARADGPERIEQEWWLQEGQHRDYYYVEDEEGRRYWLFRLGHYDAAKTYQWYMHGFFA